jgi:hypothetical protein
VLHGLWVVPSGVLLRTYSRIMFGPWRVPYLDMLYFWPSNVDPRVGRAMMRRNFSNISVGVIRQVGRRHTVNNDCVLAGHLAVGLHLRRWLEVLHLHPALLNFQLHMLHSPAVVPC